MQFFDQKMLDKIAGMWYNGEFCAPPAGGAPSKNRLFLRRSVFGEFESVVIAFKAESQFGFSF